MKRIIWLCIMCCFYIALDASNIRVSASVESDRVGLHEDVSYTISITGDSKVDVIEPVLPRIDGLTYRNVYSTTSSSFSIVNGKSSANYTKQLVYQFSPTRTGKITIPTINITVNKQRFQVNSVTFEVVKNSSPRTGSTPIQPFTFNPFNIFDEDNNLGFGYGANYGETFLYVVPEKKSVYVGEPLMVSYYVYTNQPITSMNFIEEKDFDGYGKETYSQPERLEFEDVKLNKAKYMRALIKKIAISPNRAETIKLPKISASIQYSGILAAKELTSPDVQINVYSVPENGKPDNYTGAVGNFSFSESISATTTHVGDALTLTLQINGKGNFHQFTVPIYRPNDGFQVSSPIVSDNLKGGSEGKRTIYYTLIPVQKGYYKLQGLEFSWFDTSSGTYRTYQSKPFNVEVRPGNVLSYFSNLFQRDEQRQIGKLIEQKTYHTKHFIFTSFFFWFFSLLLCGTLPVSIYLAKEKNLMNNYPHQYAAKNAQKVLRKYLREAQVLAGEQSPLFYPAAEKGLMRYLTDKYRISQRLSIAEKLQALQEKDIPVGVISDLQGFLEICQEARFKPGGFNKNKLNDHLRYLEIIIETISKLTRHAK